MASSEHVYCDMLVALLKQYEYCVPNERYANIESKTTIEDLETLVKESMPNYPEYKLFISGVAITLWMCDANVDELNAANCMLDRVCELLGIHYPEEEEK